MKSIEEQFKNHRDLSMEVILSDDAPLARRLTQALYDYVKKKGFKRSNQEFFIRYSDIITKLKWIALPLLKKEELLTLFDNNLQEALEIPYFNLKDKLLQTMLGIFDLEERDVLKKEIKEIVNRNQALLIKKNFKNGKRGTVENWIRNYVSVIGLKIADPVKFENYFVSGEDFGALSIQDVSKLKTFFFFYEYLKSSSLTPLGLENKPLFDDKEGFKVLESGVVTIAKADKEQREIAELVDRLIPLGQKTKVVEENKKVPSPPQKVLSEEEKREKAENARLEEQKRRKIFDLEKLAKTSSVGSLERKAIEEEIKKISSQK